MVLTEDKFEEAITLLKRAHKADPNTGEFAEGKVRTLLEDAIHNPRFLVLVNREVSAILVWTMTPTFFSYKNIIQEIVLYSETAGGGFRLLRESEAWLDNWGDSIESIVLSTSSENEKVDEMIERFGYKKVGSQFLRGER